LNNTYYLDKNYGLIYNKDSKYFESCNIDSIKRYFQGIRTLYLFRKICKKPISLFIEPHKECALCCKFCYAKVGQGKKENKLNIESIRDIHNKFKFKNISIYGGDPIYNKEYLKNILSVFKDEKLDSLTISTSGIGLDDDIIQEIKSSTKKLSFQISLEPKYFNKRVTKNGTHQSDILNIKKLSNIGMINVACVIPSDLENWKTFNENIKDIEDIIGNDNWACAWKLETGSEVKELPKYIYQWFEEEYNELNSCSMKRVHKGLASYLLDHIYTDSLPSQGKLPFSYGQCHAGFGAISIGPNGKFYTCHESAILDERQNEIEDISPKGIWKVSKNHISVLSSGCSNCELVFLCGGGCYRNKNKVLCEYDKLKYNLAIKYLEKFFPKALNSIVENQKKFIDFCLNQDLSFVFSEEWERLINADNSFDEIALLLEEHMNYKVNNEIFI